MSSAFIKLPPELIDLVFQFVFYSGDISALKACSIAASCSSSNLTTHVSILEHNNKSDNIFKASVERWLWRDVSIHLDGHILVKSSAKCMALAAPHLSRVIKTHPRVAPLIHTLRIYLSSYSTQLVDEECTALLQVQAIDQVSNLDARMPSSATSPRASGDQTLSSSSQAFLEVLPNTVRGVLLPNLRVLALGNEITSSFTLCAPRWSSLSRTFRTAFAERLAWFGPESSTYSASCGGMIDSYNTLRHRGHGIERIEIQNIAEFPVRLLEQGGGSLKEVSVKGHAALGSTNWIKLSSMDASSDARTLTSGQDTAKPLDLTHLTIHHCTRSLSDLADWLTSGESTPAIHRVVTPISNLRFLEFHSSKSDEWTFLSKILEACKNTLEELTVDWGTGKQFMKAYNFPKGSRPTSAPYAATYTPPPVNWHSGSPQQATIPPPTLSPIHHEIQSQFQSPTLATCLPLSLLSALRKLVLKAHIWTESTTYHIGSSLGDPQDVLERRCKTDIGYVGDLLQTLPRTADGGRLKEIEVNLELKVQGKDAPTLEEVDFSAIANALGYDSNNSGDSFETSRTKSFNGPITTLMIHPAAIVVTPSSPSTSSRTLQPAYIPFAQITSSILYNEPLMRMVRRGRVVIKGMDLVRERTEEDLKNDAQEVLRERIWRGEGAMGG